MPESMFGRPSQHLLPSRPPESAGGGSVASNPHTAPVQPVPVSFKDFRFNSIGKQPELLSRISLPQLDHSGYHSSTPSPTSTPPRAFANDGAVQPTSPSRPTLLQQLAGSEFSGSMDGGLSWHPSTSQSNRSLASRIQMSGSPSNDAVNTAHSTTARFLSHPSRVNNIRIATDDNSLIPPVEILATPPESSPTTTASLASAVDMHSRTSSTALVNTGTTRSSRIPTPPTVTMSSASREPTNPFPSLAAVDAMLQDLQPSIPASAIIDSLAARQERLQAISANLAKLVSPLPPSSSQSSSPDPSVARANDNIIPHQPSQSEHGSNPIALRYPYLANQSSGRVPPSIDNILINTNDSSLIPAHSPATITQEHQAQRKAVMEAVQNLNSALNAVHRAQINSENALVFQIRTFEEQRATFEQTKRAQEATLHKELQDLQQKREELNARDSSLASLDQENKAREVARKAMFAKRQAQEEEKRAAEAKRMQEVQEQIAAAMTELNEVEALRSKCQLGPLASETVPDDLPTELQEGMDEEEIAVIKSRNDLLRAVKHLRRMLSDEVQKLEESNRTLRRLEEERKHREARETENCRRTAEEERLRTHAEAERVRQVLDEKQRQFEAERKRQDDREQAQLLAEQQTHTEAQAHGLRRTEATNDQTFKHRSHPEEVNASQQQGIPDMTRIRAAPVANFLSPKATSAEEGGKALSPHYTVPPSNILASPGGSQSATSQSKQKDRPISSGIMLAVSAPNTSPGHLPPKPLAKASPPSVSDHVAENAVKPMRTFPAVPVSAEGGHRSPFPTPLASEFKYAVDADIPLSPDHKAAFPRTPKSRTLLDATIRESEELNIGPVTGLSPTQQNVNLRHLKRHRGRIEENDGGDRSVRTSVKREESSISLKREDHDDQSRERLQASFSTNPLPPRPTVIPPPRPRKRYAAPASQTDLTSSYPPEGSKLSSTKGGAGLTTDEQPREALSPGTPSSHAMNTSVQLPVPAETMDSLLLGPVYPAPHPIESRVNAGERPTQDRAENNDAISSESASATLSHELNGNDLSRSDRRFTDEHYRARGGNNARRHSDRYSPPFVASRSTVTSPTQPQPYRRIDSWRPRNASNGPRAEAMRATSPNTGRKRLSEFTDDEHNHRARRHRGDAWVSQDHDHDRVDSYRPHRDRRLDSEPDERRAAYRAPTSPTERIWSYPSDIPRGTYDNRTHISPFSEEPTAHIASWEPSYRRSENDDTYSRHSWETSYVRPDGDDTSPRYQPSAPGYHTIADQHHTDEIRVGQTYEPMMEERTDVQSDPSLLARMSSNNTQRFPVNVS